MITVKQLRERIAALPDDTIIVLQKDDEGNGYRYMNGVDFAAEGDDANYFNDDEDECYRGSDAKFIAEECGTDIEDLGAPVAVVY